jgi:cytochrome P450
MSPARSDYPPGPRGAELVISLLAYRKDALGFLVRLARDYGDMVHFRLGPRHVFFLRHPDAVKDVLGTRPTNFAKGVGYQWTKQFLGEGLITSEGDLHQRQRRSVQGAFHRHRVAGYADVMTACAERMADRWRDGTRLDVHREMRHLSLVIVGRALFDADLEPETSRIDESLASIQQAFRLFYRFALPCAGLIHRLPLPSHLRFHRAVARLDEVVARLISERRRAGGDSGDLLSILLRAQDGGRTGGGARDAQIRDEVVTLLAAGYDTSASALTWTWYLLSQHPDVEARLHRELAAVLGGRRPTADDVPSLDYTRAVFAESLRLYPPAYAFGRTLMADHRWDGCVLPAGSSVLLSAYVTHRDPRFFPEPLRFDPQRWTREEGEAPHEFAYFPFGGGPRRCIGEGFAWAEGVLVIATIAQRWRLRLVSGHPVEPQGLLTLQPRYGMRMRIERRAGG